MNYFAAIEQLGLSCRDLRERLNGAEIEISQLKAVNEELTRELDAYRAESEQRIVESQSIDEVVERAR